MASECSLDSTITTSSFHHSLSSYSDEESIYIETSGSEDSIHIERPVIDNPCLGEQSNSPAEWCNKPEWRQTHSSLQSLKEWTKNNSLPKSQPKEEWPDDEPYEDAQKQDVPQPLVGRKESWISEADRKQSKRPAGYTNYAADTAEVTAEKAPVCTNYVANDVEVTPDFCRIGNESWHSLWPRRNKSAPPKGLSYDDSNHPLCFVEKKCHSLSSRNQWIGTATCNPTSFESDDTASTLPGKNAEDDNSSRGSVRISEIQIYTSKMNHKEGTEYGQGPQASKDEDVTGGKVPQREDVMETDYSQTMHPFSQKGSTEVTCFADDDDLQRIQQGKKEKIQEKEKSKFLFQNDADIESISFQNEMKTSPLTTEETGNNMEVEVTLDSFSDEYEEGNQPLHSGKKITTMARPMKKVLRVVKNRRAAAQRREGATEKAIVCDQTTQITQEFSQGVELMNLDTFSDEGQDYSSWNMRKRYSTVPSIVFCCLLLVACALAVAVGVVYFSEKQNDRTRDAANALTQSATAEGGMNEFGQDITASPTGLQTKPPTASPTMVPISLSTKMPISLPTKMPSPMPTKMPISLPTKMPSPIPTKMPSPSPTGSPSTLPTPAQTRCVTQIATDFHCYNRNENVDIIVSFEQCNPNVDDWVGVYPAGSNGQTLGEDYLEWSWACGDKECQGEAFSNSISIMDAERLEVGWYQAFLLRENDFGQYRSLASSVFFLVSNSECE